MAFRDSDGKILSSQDFSKVELYNLKTDPKDATDLSGKKTERLAAMTKRLKGGGRGGGEGGAGLEEAAQSQRRRSGQEEVTPTSARARPRGVAVGRAGEGVTVTVSLLS